MKRTREALLLSQSESPSKRGANQLHPTVGNLVFGQLLAKSGLNFRRSGQPILSEDQAIFQNNLKAAIKSHHEYPQIIEEFVAGFAEFVEDGQHLSLCLSPTLTDTDCTSARKNYQDSLIRLLLGNTDLQPKLITVLLEKLVECCSESDDAESSLKGADVQQVPKLILFQFRWLDTLVDNKAFCNKFLEIFACTSVEIQKEMILLVPEILDDSEHEAVGKSWRDCLNVHNHLIVPILDTLPNLAISEDVLCEVKEITLNKMDSAELHELPVITKFLLQSITAEDAFEILKGLKSKLNFAGNLLLERTEMDRMRSHEVLMLEVLKTEAQYQKLVGDTLLKLLDIERIETDGFQLSDLLIIFVLLDVHERRKATEAVVVNVIRRGLVNKSLIRNSFKNYPQICHEYHLSIRGLADTLLCMNEPSFQQYGKILYAELFAVVEIPSILQEIVECLYMHTCSGRSSELDASLDVLLKLVCQHKEKIAPFGVFLKSFLDYLETFSLVHVRKVYDILGLLCRGGRRGTDSDENELHDDLHIIVRKQLSNSCSKYRRMGVVGTLTLIKSLLRSSNDSEDISDATIQSAQDLLTFIEKQVEQDTDAKLLFYDDLATAIVRNELHPKLQEFLADHITNDFQDDFVVDATDECLQKIPMADGELLFLLDESTEVGIALNLLPIAAQDSGKQLPSAGKRRVWIACLAPHFRLLRFCEQVTHNNSLEGIDALLGCPVYFLSQTVLENFHSSSNNEKRFICRCCFALVNWFIELINAFVTQSDPEIQGKVLIRIHQIVEIKQKLAKFLANTVDFIPPIARFGMEVEFASPPTKSNPKPATKRKKAAAKTDTDNSQTQSSVKASISPSKGNQETDMEKPKKMPPVNMNLYACYFRELDMDVFSVLKYKLALGNEKEEALMLKLDDLLFLLEDLQCKLEQALCPVMDASKRGNVFAKMKTLEPTVLHCNLLLEPSSNIAKSAVKLLPFVRMHLDIIAVHFRKTANSADSDDEMLPSLNCEELLAKAVKLLLLVVLTVIKWEGFKSCKQALLLDDVLGSLVSKMPTSSQVTTDHLLMKAFSYLCKLIEVCPNFTCTVVIVNILDVMVEKNTTNRLSDRLAEVTTIVLKKKWDEFTGLVKDVSSVQGDLTKLLSIHFKMCQNKLDVLEELITKAIPELIKAVDDTGTSATYPTLTSVTLPVFYNVLHDELIKMIRKKYSKNTEDDEEQLLLWSLSVKLFHILVNLVKEFETHKMFLICLKSGRIFVELFIKWAMPLLDRTFRTHKEDVQTLLKALQLSTRSLQHLCSHSKLSKGVSLTNYVPPLRKVLEGLVYRVKAMLTINQCKQAFWIGNLKNRNLQGQEILSQPSQDEDQTGLDLEDPVASQEDTSAIRNENGSEPQSENESLDNGNNSDSY